MRASKLALIAVVMGNKAADRLDPARSPKTDDGLVRKGIMDTRATMDSIDVADVGASKGRPEAGEAGLINLGLLGAATLATIFVLLGVFSLGIASSSAQSNQNAADAAALAGAEAFDPAGRIYFAGGFSTTAELRAMVEVSGPCPAQVWSSASSYASKNGARLESCFMREWGEVRVTTRMDVPIDGAQDGKATAEADWSLNLKNCYIDPSFSAQAVTGVAWTWMQCDDERFDLKYLSGRFWLHPWGQVKQAIHHEVHLVE